MKINEVIVEGIGSTLGNVAKGIGRGLGSAATGVVRGLDKLAGGTGDVGTASQRAAYQLKQADKNFAKQSAIMATLGDRAEDEFNKELRQRGINIAQPNTYDPNEVRQELQFFANEFFGSDTDRVVSEYVKRHIQDEPLPTNLNHTTINHYLNTINNYRTEAITSRFKAAHTVAMMRQAEKDQAAQKEITTQAERQVEVDRLVAQIKQDQANLNKLKQMGKDTAQTARKIATNTQLLNQLLGREPEPSTPAPTQPAAANQPVTLPSGVQIIRMAGRDAQGRPTPTVVRYRRQDFGLLDNGQWINIMNGKPVPQTLASFLQQELESAT